MEGSENVFRKQPCLYLRSRLKNNLLLHMFKTFPDWKRRVRASVGHERTARSTERSNCGYRGPDESHPRLHGCASRFAQASPSTTTRNTGPAKTTTDEYSTSRYGGKEDCSALLREQHCAHPPSFYFISPSYNVDCYIPCPSHSNPTSHHATLVPGIIRSFHYTTTYSS